MSNFKMWYSANVQLLKKQEYRKIAPMLEFGGRMMGKGKGIKRQVSELRGLAWFVRASKAAAKKVETGYLGYGLVAECDSIIEKLDKHFKGKEEYSHLFEAAYKTRAELRASLHNKREAADDSAKAEEFGKVASKLYALQELTSLAYVKFKKKDYASALEDFSKAMEIAPENSHFYFFKRGFVKYCMGDYEGAVAEYTAAIGLSPDYARAYQERSEAKYMLGDKSSIADCDTARKLDPEGYHPYPHLNKARSSIENCSRSIEFDPGNPELYSIRGDLKSFNGDYAGAVEDFTKAVELLKEQPKTLEMLNAHRHALSGRSYAKFKRSEVSSLFSVSNYSGWKEDETDAMTLGRIIYDMEKQAKAEKVPLAAAR